MASWVFTCESSYTGWMRIAVCTRIPIIHLQRSKRFQFCIVWNETVVCRCRRCRFGMTKWTQACSCKTTESGHKRSSLRCGKGESRHPSWFVFGEKKRTKTEIKEKKQQKKRKLFAPLIQTPQSFLSVEKKMFTSLSPQAHGWNVIEAHIEGVDGGRFSWKYNPEWGRGRTVQKVARRGRGIAHTSRCLSVARTAPRDGDLLPSTGFVYTLFFKHSSKLLLLFFNQQKVKLFDKCVK